MQFKKEHIKNQFRKIAKQTWAGPGKFGVLIFLCILIIAFFESLGLTNRENVIEMRNVEKTVIPIKEALEPNQLLSESRIQKLDTNEFRQILQKYDHLYTEQKEYLRDSILLDGVVDQYLYENGKSHNSTTQIELNAKVNDKLIKYIELLNENYDLSPTLENAEDSQSNVELIGMNYIFDSSSFSDI